MMCMPSLMVVSKPVSTSASKHSMPMMGQELTQYVTMRASVDLPHVVLASCPPWMRPT
jgi:uncharacterized protein YcgI (DUF1989 family)